MTLILTLFYPCISLVLPLYYPYITISPLLLVGVPTGAEGKIEGEEGRVLDEVLGELYVFLVRESNLALNTVYAETVIDR